MKNLTRCRACLFLLFCASSLALSQQANDWVQLAQPCGGAVLAMTADFRGNVIIGMSCGLYLSSDQGSTWKFLSNRLTNLHLRSLAVTSAEFIFAAADTNSLYRTTDLGATWEPAPLPPRPYKYVVAKAQGPIFTLVFSPQDSGWVYRSNDNGETWTDITAGLRDAAWSGNSFAYYITADDVGNVYVGKWASGYYAAHRWNPIGGGLAYSADDGTHWNWLGLYGYNVAPVTRRRDGTIMCGQYLGSWNTVKTTDVGYQWTPTGLKDYIVQSLQSSLMDVYVGTTAGALVLSPDDYSWTPMNTGLVDTNLATMTKDTSGFIYVATAGGLLFRTVQSTFRRSPLAPPVILAPRSGSYVGPVANFSWIRSVGARAYHVQIASSPSFSDAIVDTILLSTSLDGIATIIDSVRYWHVSSLNSAGEGAFSQAAFFFGGSSEFSWETLGLPAAGVLIEALAVNSSFDILAGSNKGGLYRFRHDNRTWSAVEHTGSQIRSIIVNNSGNDIYTGSYDGILSHSTNGGATWSTWSITWGMYPIGIYALAVDRHAILYASIYREGGSELWRSSDGGQSWRNSALPLCSAILVAKNDALYAGTMTAGIFLSSDHGVTWNRRNVGLTALDISALALDSLEILYAGTHSGGIFRSTDSGQTWGQVNNGLSSTNVTSLIADPSDQIFAGTIGGGFCVTTNCGAHWASGNLGFSNTDVLSLATDDRGYVYAGTGDGVVFKSSTAFRRTNHDTATSPFLPTSSTLFQNYPNPFNPGTTIEYSLPQPSYVTLTLYNILGQRIRTLVDEAEPSGTYKVRLDGSGLASGVYLYRIWAGNFTATKKLVLLR